MIDYLMHKLGYNIIGPGSVEMMKPGERRLIPGGSKVQMPKGTSRARPGQAPVGSQALQVMKYAEIKEKGHRLFKPVPSTRPGKKYMVYVRGKNGNKKLIHFGAKGYSHNYSEGAKSNFRARHRCSQQKDRSTPAWWACNYLWHPKQRIGKKTYSKDAQYKEAVSENLIHRAGHSVRKNLREHIDKVRPTLGPLQRDVLSPQGVRQIEKEMVDGRVARLLRKHKARQTKQAGGVPNLRQAQKMARRLGFNIEKSKNLGGEVLFTHPKLDLRGRQNARRKDTSRAIWHLIQKAQRLQKKASLGVLPIVLPVGVAGMTALGLYLDATKGQRAAKKKRLQNKKSGYEDKKDRKLLKRILQTDTLIAPSGPPLGSSKQAADVPSSPGKRKPIKAFAGKDSSVFKDFVYGLDPTGRGTFESGLTNRESHARHKAVGALGGFLGGATLIPSAISALIDGVPDAMRAKGLKGRVGAIAAAAYAPYKTLFRGHKMSRSLKGIAKGKRNTLSSKEVQNLRSLADEAPLKDLKGGLSDLRGLSALKSPQIHLGKGGVSMSPEAAHHAHQALSRGVRRAAAGLSISGGIGGGSALIQYSSGQNTQRRVDRELNAQVRGREMRAASPSPQALIDKINKKEWK